MKRDAQEQGKLERGASIGILPLISLHFPFHAMLAHISLHNTLFGIVKLSEIEQKLGNTRIHNSLIVQHSGSWLAVENQPNLGTGNVSIN